MKKTIFIFDCSGFSSQNVVDEFPSQKLLTEFQKLVGVITDPFLVPYKGKVDDERPKGEYPIYAPTIVSSADAQMYFFAHAAARATSTHFVDSTIRWKTNPDDMDQFTMRLQLAEGFVIGVSHYTPEKLMSVLPFLNPKVKRLKTLKQTFTKHKYLIVSYEN